MELQDDFEVFPEVENFTEPLVEDTMEIEDDNTVSLALESSLLTTPIKNRLMVEAPVKGMFFASVEEGEEYYREYGRCMGFDARRRSSDKKEFGSKRVTSCLMVCDREGKHKKVSACDPSKIRNTSTGKCDCKAGMRFTWRPAGFYEVTTVVLEHSHKLVSPSKMMKMKVNRFFPEVAKNLTKRFHDEGVPVGKVAAVFGGSVIGFSPKDCQNHFGKTKKNPKKGDATAVLQYLQRKKENDPQFFYTIDSDEEGRAINFFWIDSRSRMQYDHFGDVVVFDTTYKTNSYSMPFAPFTGVNHHLQTIQFGCALLLDETEDTFVWLFKTWLAAMGGRPPVSILTDQDRAMTAAVARVFPDTRHRFCLWHITKKFPEKFCQIINKNDGFHDELKLIISCSYRIEDFEEGWKSHMQKYNLDGDSWVIELYEIRHKWVPAYHLNTFYAGMNTTGRGESMNSMYDNFVDHNTNLIDFVIGLPCGHILKVLLRHDIDLIPDHFILRRWRVGANSYRSIFNHDGTRATGRDDLGALQQLNLSKVSAEFTSHCSHSDDYKYAMDMFKLMFLEVDHRKEARQSQIEDTIPDLVVNDACSVEPTQILLLNPNISQTKGRKHAVRYKRGCQPSEESNIAGASNGNVVHNSEEGKERGCRRCKKAKREFVGHDWRNCSFNPKPKKSRFKP